MTLVDLTHLSPDEALKEARRLVKRSKGTKPHKYGARKTTYNGQVYDSQAEADYAAALDRMKAAGAIADWCRGSVLVLVPGKRSERVTYIPDFWVLENDGEGHYVDVKGVETPVFKLKMKLLRHAMPTARLLIVGKKGERWLP